MTNKIEENDIVLCTVKKIEKTTVFLEVHINSHTIQGTMIFSEVSAGRIRNIRDFITINKKIVCKVLRVSNGHPELSLRRVSAKERDFVLDEYKKERTLEKMLKQVLKDDYQKALEKIKESYTASEFLDEAREDSKIIEKFVSKSQSQELQKIFSSSKETKEKSVKKEIKLQTISETGIKDIKEILEVPKEIEIHYLGSSKFSITVKAKDYKSANVQLENILEEIKEKSKKLKAKIEIKEK